MEKTVKYGEYQITKAENGSIKVFKNDELQKSAMAALREIAQLVGVEIEESWNTQQTGAKLIKAIEERLSADAGSGINASHFMENFGTMESQEKTPKLTPAEHLVQLALRMCVNPEDNEFNADLFDMDELINIASSHGFEEDDLIDAYNGIMESGELLAMDEITEGVSVGLADAIIATCCCFCLINEQVYKYQIATIHGFCKECGVNGESVTLWLVEFLKKKYTEGDAVPDFETIDF